MQLAQSSGYKPLEDMDDGRCLLDSIDDPDALTSFLDKEQDDFGLDSADLEEFSRYQQLVQTSQYAAGSNSGGLSMQQETPSSVLLQLENISPPPVQNETVLGLMGDRPFTPTSHMPRPGQAATARPIIDLGFGEQEGGEIKEIFPDFLSGNGPEPSPELSGKGDDSSRKREEKNVAHLGQQSSSVKDDFSSIFSFENENESPSHSIPTSSLSTGKVQDVLQQSLDLAGVGDLSGDALEPPGPEDDIRNTPSSAVVQVEPNQIPSLNIQGNSSVLQSIPMSSSSATHLHAVPPTAVTDIQRTANKSIPQVAVVRPQTQPQPQPQPPPQNQVLNSQGIIGSQGQAINSQYLQTQGKVVVSGQQPVVPMPQTYVLNTKSPFNIHSKSAVGNAGGMQPPKAATAQPQGIRIMLAPQHGGNIAAIGSAANPGTIQLNQGQGTAQGQQTVLLHNVQGAVQQGSGSSVPVLQPVITIGATQGSFIFMTRPTTVLAPQQIQQLQTTGSGLATIQVPNQPQALGPVVQPGAFTVSQQPGEKQALPVVQLVQPGVAGGKAYQTITLPQGYVAGGQTIVIQNPQGATGVLPIAQSQARIVRSGPGQMSFVQSQPTGAYGKVQGTPQLIQPKIVSTAQTQQNSVTLPAQSMTSNPQKAKEPFSSPLPKTESTVVTCLSHSANSSAVPLHMSQIHNSSAGQLSKPVHVSEQVEDQKELHISKSESAPSGSQPTETFRHKLYGKISTVQQEFKSSQSSSRTNISSPMTASSSSVGHTAVTSQTILQKVQPQLAGSSSVTQGVPSQSTVLTSTSVLSTLVHAHQHPPPATTVVAPSNINAKDLPTKTQSLPGNNGSVSASVHLSSHLTAPGSSPQPTSGIQNPSSTAPKQKMHGTQRKKQNMFGSQNARQSGQFVALSKDGFQAEFLKSLEAKTGHLSSNSETPAASSSSIAEVDSFSTGKQAEGKQTLALSQSISGSECSVYVPGSSEISNANAHNATLINALEVKAKQMKEFGGMRPMTPQPMVSALQLKAQQMMSSQASTLDQQQFRQNQPLMSALEIKNAGGFQSQTIHPAKNQQMMSALELKQQIELQASNLQTRPVVSALQLQEMQRQSNQTLSSGNNTSTEVNHALQIQQRHGVQMMVNRAKSQNVPSVVAMHSPSNQAQDTPQLQNEQRSQLPCSQTAGQLLPQSMATAVDSANLRNQLVQIQQRQNSSAVVNQAQSQGHAIYVPLQSASHQGPVARPPSRSHQIPSPQEKRPPSAGQPLPSPQAGNSVSSGNESAFHYQFFQTSERQSPAQTMVTQGQNQVLSNPALVARPPSTGQPLLSSQGPSISSVGQPSPSPVGNQSVSHPIPSPQSGQPHRPPSTGQPLPSPRAVQTYRHGVKSQTLPSPQAAQNQSTSVGHPTRSPQAVHAHGPPSAGQTTPSPQGVQVHRPLSGGQPIPSPQAVQLNRPPSAGQPMPSPQSSQTSRPPSRGHPIPSPQGLMIQSQGSFQGGTHLQKQTSAPPQVLQNPQGFHGFSGQFVQNLQGNPSQMGQTQPNIHVQSQHSAAHGQAVQKIQTQPDQQVQFQKQTVSDQVLHQSQGGGPGSFRFSSEKFPHLLEAFELLKQAQAAQAKGPSGAQEQAQYMQQFQHLLQKHPDLLRQLQLLKQKQHMAKQQVLEKQQQMGSSMPEHVFKQSSRDPNNQQPRLPGALTASAGQAQLVASSILQAAQGVNASGGNSTKHGVIPSSAAQTSIPHFLQPGSKQQSITITSINASTQGVQFQSGQSLPQAMNPDYTPNVTIQATSGQKDGIPRTVPVRSAVLQRQPPISQTGQDRKKTLTPSTAMLPPPPPASQQPPPNVSIVPSQKKVPLGTEPSVTKEKDVFEFDDDDSAPPTLETKFSIKAASAHVASGTVHHQPAQKQNVLSGKALLGGSEPGQSQVQIQSLDSIVQRGHPTFQRGQLSKMLQSEPAPSHGNGSGIPPASIQSQGAQPGMSMPQMISQASSQVPNTSTGHEPIPGMGVATSQGSVQSQAQDGNLASRRLQQIQQIQQRLPTSLKSKQKPSKAGHLISVKTQQNLQSVQGFIRQLEDIHKRTPNQEAMLQKLLTLQQTISEEAKAKLEAVTRQGQPATPQALTRQGQLATPQALTRQGQQAAPQPAPAATTGQSGPTAVAPQGQRGSSAVLSVQPPTGSHAPSQVQQGSLLPVCGQSRTTMSSLQPVSGVVTMTAATTTVAITTVAFVGQAKPPVYTSQSSQQAFSTTPAASYQTSMAPSSITFHPATMTAPVPAAAAAGAPKQSVALAFQPSTPQPKPQAQPALTVVPQLQPNQAMSQVPQNRAAPLVQQAPTVVPQGQQQQATVVATQAGPGATGNPVQQIFSAKIVQLVGNNLTPQQQEMLNRLQDQLKNMTPQQQQDFYLQHQAKLKKQDASKVQSGSASSTAVQPPQQPSSSTPASKPQLSPVRSKPARGKAKKKGSKASPKGSSDKAEEKGSVGNDVEIVATAPPPPPQRIPTPPPAAADFLRERRSMDIQLVENLNFKTPFASYSEAVQRLLPFHMAFEKIPSRERCEETASSFEEISRNLLDKKQKMLDQFQMLLYNDSMRKEPSSEAVMLQRMFIQDEKSALQEERKLAEANRGLVESLMPKIKPAQGGESIPQVAPSVPRPAHTFAQPARVDMPKAEPRAKTNHDRIRSRAEMDSPTPSKKFASSKVGVQRQPFSSSDSDSSKSAVGVESSYHSAIVSKYPSSDEEDVAGGSKSASGGGGGIRLRLTKSLLVESNVRSRDTQRSESEESVLSSPTKPKRRKSRLEALLSSDSLDSSSDVNSPSLDHRTKGSPVIWSVSQSQFSQDPVSFQETQSSAPSSDGQDTHHPDLPLHSGDVETIEGQPDISTEDKDPLQEQMDSAVNSILFLQNPFGNGSTSQEAGRHPSLADISFDNCVDDVFDSADDSAVFNVDDYANASFLEENSAVAGLESEFSSMETDLL